MVKETDRGRSRRGSVLRDSIERPSLKDSGRNSRRGSFLQDNTVPRKSFLTMFQNPEETNPLNTLNPDIQTPHTPSCFQKNKLEEENSHRNINLE
jgi:hypothetical protein